ncbi:Two-pore potassium channel 3 [Senna tora]|uniref:Two-pore potassium channel 3 n=1 Tax=Senna tora TaxID=362788 RepID=A0A834WG00_9FABA|nr:Two-pore potassium channel 3 [Senna tora]
MTVEALIPLLECDMEAVNEKCSASLSNEMKKQDIQKIHPSWDKIQGGELWNNGLICAFEFIPGSRKMKSTDAVKEVAKRNNSRYCSNESSLPVESGVGHLDAIDGQDDESRHILGREGLPRNYWRPIGWARISELVQTVHTDADWASQLLDFSEDESDVTIAEVTTPYWERPVGPTWWCHVDAGHPFISAWLSSAQWLHPAIRIALQEESKLISERMKYLLYEVPVRVAGGLLFELLGQSAGDPFVEEDDISIVLRAWQAQNFLVTALHVKGSASNVNVLGIIEVQEVLAAGGTKIPHCIHELVAHLASRLARWDDRLFRKHIFGAADEIELMFMNRRNHEDLHLFSIILNQEIRRFSSQAIRVKWSLHAREEIVFELLQQLRGNETRSLLEGVRKSTREMIEEQEAVRGRLFTIQDVMQSTVRSWLQDKSLRVTHNLGVFGGGGLILSVITGLFGINVDGIPGAADTPYAFALFSGLLFLLGALLIGTGLLYLGLKKPIIEENVAVRKLELQELVKMFQHEAESHAQLRNTVPHKDIPQTEAVEEPLLSQKLGGMVGESSSSSNRPSPIRDFRSSYIDLITNEEVIQILTTPKTSPSYLNLIANLKRKKEFVHRSHSAPSVFTNIKEDCPDPFDPRIAQKSSPFIVRLSSIGVILYVSIGVLVYLTSDGFKGTSTFKLVDAMYFTMVTLCTIGYGDIVPDTDLTKIFTCGFILVGFGLVGILLNGLVTYICDRQEAMLLSTMDENQFHTMVRYLMVDKEKGRMRIRTKVSLALAIVICCIAIGTIAAYFLENLSWVNSFYLSVTSVTTVGYGDYAFKTLQGRCFAIIWLLVSTLAVGRAFLYLTEYSIDKRNRTITNWILHKKITLSDLVAADLDNDGSISKSEFVIYKLKEMGKITEIDIQQISKQFDSLDSTKCGKITLAGLMETV